jgi:hypothetical protein
MERAVAEQPAEPDQADTAGEVDPSEQTTTDPLADERDSGSEPSVPRERP